jgi:cyclophilin family peptidyl-prolyl cis-trans isomerase
MYNVQYMCKKGKVIKKITMAQKKSSFSRTSAGFLLAIIVLGLAFAPSSQSGSDIDEWNQLVDTLTPVWIAASERNERVLFTFAQHDNPEIRNAAWRGLANFSLQDTDQSIDLALQANSETAWFALSTQSLRSDQIQRIMNLALQTDETGLRNVSGMFLVLGKQGDIAAHNWFLDIARHCLHQSNTEADSSVVPKAGTEHAPLELTRLCAPQVRFDLALGVSRSLNRHHQSGQAEGSANTDTNVHMMLLQLAMNSSDAMEQAAWLYGWYRTPSIRLPDDVLRKLQQWIATDWPEAYGLTRQYWINLLGRHQLTLLPRLIIEMPVEEMHILEWVEAARGLGSWQVPSSEVDQALLKLLANPHDQVRVVALETTLTRYDFASAELKNKAASIASGMLPLEKLARHRIIARSNPEVTVAFFNSEDGVATLLQAPGLAGAWLGLFSQVSGAPSALEFAANLVSNPQTEEIVRRQFAYYSTLYLSTLTGPPGASEGPDASVLSAILSFLEVMAEDAVVSASGVVANTVSAFSIDRAWVTEATKRNPAFAEMLRFGASFEEYRSETLLAPNADVLKQVGPSPEWVIHTTAGSMRLRLDPLRSPSTVTAYYELTREAQHDGTAFHRIVPNFVIQSGMLWNPQTGGSPAFRIPTEASEKTFARGTLGVASAGRDTEGSQFFVMHMWHPHLDGGYTNFGHLTEGHEVLDALLQGATVLSTEWR